MDQKRRRGEKEARASEEDAGCRCMSSFKKFTENCFLSLMQERVIDHGDVDCRKVDR